MKAWARKKYTPLIEFAYYDNESTTGGPSSFSVEPNSQNCWL
jgi:hypothetical protein